MTLIYKMWNNNILKRFVDFGIIDVNVCIVNYLFIIISSEKKQKVSVHEINGNKKSA